MRRWSRPTTARQFVESRIDVRKIARRWTNTLLKPRLVQCKCLARFGFRRTPAWLEALSERPGGARPRGVQWSSRALQRRRVGRRSTVWRSRNNHVPTINQLPARSCLPCPRCIPRIAFQQCALLLPVKIVSVRKPVAGCCGERSSATGNTVPANSDPRIAAQRETPER